MPNNKKTEVLESNIYQIQKEKSIAYTCNNLSPIVYLLI